MRGGKSNLVHLNDVFFSNALRVDVHYLILSGKIADPLESRPRKTTLKLYGGKVDVRETASLYADRLFLFANETIKVGKNAIIASTQPNECTTDNKGNLDLYECMPPEYDGDMLTREYVLAYFNEQYGLKRRPNYDYRAHHPGRMEANVLKKWNVYLLAIEELTL